MNPVRASRPLYGAIAYSPSTRRYGWSAAASDLAFAESLALTNCREPDAGILARGHNIYLALAIGYAGGGWGRNDDPMVAGRLALDQGWIQTVNPRLEVVFHTGNGKNLANEIAPHVAAATRSPIQPPVWRKSHRTVSSTQSAAQPSVTGGWLNVAVLDDKMNSFRNVGGSWNHG